MKGEVVRERGDGRGIEEGDGKVGQEFNEGGVLAVGVAQGGVSCCIDEFVAVGERGAGVFGKAARFFEKSDRFVILGRVRGRLRAK